MKVYADHAATTPMRPEAKEAMIEALEDFGNPSRSKSLTRNTRRNCWKWPRITWHKKKATCARCCQHGAGGNIDDGKPSDIPILYQVPGRNTSRK